MHRAAEHFDVVIWRSVRDAPTVEALLDDCLRALAPQAPGAMPDGLDQRLSLLFEQLRAARVLLVSVLAVTWSPDGQRLIGHHGMVTGVAWSPDGAHLASG